MKNNLKHILVVDDDDRIRDLLKEYLNEKNYIVSTSDNAENAKIKISQFKFDLIVLDVMMPGQDGYDLTKEIKRDLKIPIILLTAKGEVENRIRGLELGADDYLGKPFEPKELLLRIKNIINKIHVAIATWEWGSYFDPKLKLKGIRLNISSWRRPNPNSIPWDTKAAGLYMICTLSKHEAESKGFTDSLMLDHEGNIAEATGANVFFKNEKGELHTPIPDSFLDGITRREVIKIAKTKGIKVLERKIKPEELKDFVGCFLTGTAAEITPVSEINEYKFKICELISDLNKSYQFLVRKKTAA